MFKKKEDIVETVIENVTSLIGENIKIIGNIEGKGSLRIDGIVEGDINYDGTIYIGETGSVLGDITGAEISLAGTINGDITSKEQLVIFPTGILIGNIEVSSFIINENAKFDGNCKMTTNNITELHEKDKSRKEASK